MGGYDLRGYDKCHMSTSLVVQWRRLRASNLRGGGQIQSLLRELDPMCHTQLRVRMPQLKRSHVLQLRPSAAK